MKIELQNGRTVSVGDKVYWEDIDNDLSSGEYIITKIYNEEMGLLYNEAGSEVEVFWDECR